MAAKVAFVAATNQRHPTALLIPSTTGYQLRPVLVVGQSCCITNSLIRTTFQSSQLQQQRQQRQQQKQKHIRYTMGNVSMNLFGLGIGEIIVILIGIGVVIGPSGIIKVATETTSRAIEIKDEIQNVPKEFQKGIEIGEIEARSRKAKRIVVVGGNNNNNTNDNNDSNNKREDGGRGVDNKTKVIEDDSIDKNVDTGL